MECDLEKEVKLFGGYNNQLKYTDCSVKDTFRKIGSILNVLEIKQEQRMKEILQRDIYFDTVDYRIRKQGGSVRIRIVKEDLKEKVYLTLKNKVDSEIIARQDALVRNEEEFEMQDINSAKLILQEKAKLVFGLQSSEKIIEQVEVNKVRNYCDIKTDSAKYELCYDKFRYIDPTDHSESHYYYEMEIETKCEDRTVANYEDKKISSLIKIFKEVMGFQHDGKSKYIRGIEWKNKNNCLQNKIFIVLDIVGYSKYYSDEQKKKVEKFTDIVKNSLKNIEDAKCIPIGDGMIIITPEKNNIFPFINELFDKINKVNGSRNEEGQIHIRTAIHIGMVMTYYDINENKNFAGHGINIAYRINSGADSGQILVSEDFYMYMKHRGLVEEENYEKVEPLRVKHDVLINVYNYYDSNLVIGKRVNLL